MKQLLAMAGLLLIAPALAWAGPLEDGNALFAQGKYQEALQHYEHVSATDQDYGAALYNQGVTVYQLAHYDTALAAFRGAAQAGYEFAGLRDSGNALYRLSRFQEAADMYKQALRLKPGDPDTAYNLALALRQLSAQQEDRADSPGDGPPPKQQDSGDTQAGGQAPQPQPQAPSGMSRETAEQILQGLNDYDKETQQQVARHSAPQETVIEKDW